MVKLNKKISLSSFQHVLSTKSCINSSFIFAASNFLISALITLNSQKENGKRTDSTSFPGWCQGTNHGDISILITWEMNCQQCLLDTQPSDTSAEKKTSKDASHHRFALIVLTLCIFFFT